METWVLAPWAEERGSWHRSDRCTWHTTPEGCSQGASLPETVRSNYFSLYHSLTRGSSLWDLFLSDLIFMESLRGFWPWEVTCWACQKAAQPQTCLKIACGFQWVCVKTPMTYTWFEDIVIIPRNEKDTNAQLYVLRRTSVVVFSLEGISPVIDGDTSSNYNEATVPFLVLIYGTTRPLWNVLSS